MTNKSETNSCTITRDFNYAFVVEGLTWDETGRCTKSRVGPGFKNITEAILFYENQCTKKPGDLGFIKNNTEYYIEVIFIEVKKE